MTTDCLIELKNIALVYRALPALRNVNWTLSSGEQWVVLGPNGAGKTSLARVLSRQATHQSGELHRSEAVAHKGVAYVCFEEQKALCDRDRKLDDSEFRADASDPGTRVRDLILGDREPHDRFHQWVDRLGIEPLLNRGLRYISTGETRKTLLLRAILSDPALLILDSPLDGLDLESQEELRHIIGELQCSASPLLLLCRQTQDISPNTTHVLVLDDGEVLLQGPRAEVLNDPRVKALMNPPHEPLGPLPPSAPRPYAVADADPLIQLRKVTVRYGEQTVLRDVSWTFERGQHALIAGPNGCGKTTLLSLVTGDNHKAYGQDITLFGRRRGSGESVWEIKQKYGQLDTQLHLNWVRGMRVIEVVVSGFFDTVGLYDDWGDQQRDIAQSWLAALGLAAHAGEAFDALSFGLQRMVLLTRAMVKSPLILLLDEPTLGLDGHHRNLVLRAIDHIATHSDTQILFVSHCAGERPSCINQHLIFKPAEDGYEVSCTNRA